MLNLTLTVIIHGIILTGNLGSIQPQYCEAAARTISGDNWVVSCTNNSYTIGGAEANSWTVGGCSYDQHGNISCR